MKRLIVGLLLLSACYPKWQKDMQKRDQYFFSLCPPGNACFAHAFAVNRLNHPIAWKYDKQRQRFIHADDHDKDAGILLPGGVVDFALQPDNVVATPGANPWGLTQGTPGP